MKTYLRRKIRNVIDIRELIALEYLDFEGKYRDYAEAHDFWELCYAEKGQITVHLGDTGIALAQGQVILLPPNKKHAFTSENGNDNRVFVACFDSFSQALPPVSASVITLPDALLGCMQTIVYEASATFCTDENGLLDVVEAPLFGGQQAILLQLEYLLICLARQISAEKNAGIVFLREENFHADLVNVIHRFLRKNIDKKLTLEDVCQQFNYSKAFLCRIFKEQTGQTLIGYLTQLRIEEAQRLLLQTELPVKDIAAALGFREVKYFDAVFKKATGITPVNYRKKGIYYENRSK